MSLHNTIPIRARPIQTATVFTATFNVPTVNRYDFNIAGNTNIRIFPIQERSIYYLDRINFSLDVPEADFKNAIDVIPTLSLKSEKTEVQIFPTAIPFINYVDNLEFQLYWEGEQNKDFLLGTFRGVLKQPPALFGRLELKAQVQLNIYEIRDDWFKKYFKNPKGMEQGEDLAMRGRCKVV